ncbi:MAG TPA: hypothetical protein VG078_03255, partial [Acidimicrobiales bacterium]|nr:hypothetical protein [Acidimicrobiales bacterium]
MTLTRPSFEGLVSRTRPLTDAPDLLAALGDDGFAWLHDGGGLATSGVAARIRVGPGPDRFSAAADEVAGDRGGQVGEGGEPDELGPGLGHDLPAHGLQRRPHRLDDECVLLR